MDLLYNTSMHFGEHLTLDGYNGKDKDGLYLAAAYGVATQIDQLDEKSPERKRLLNTLLNYCTNNCAYLNQE